MVILEKEMAQLLFGANKAIIGGAGNTAELGQAWLWLDDPGGTNLPKIKYSEFIAVTSNKEIYTGTNLKDWIKVEEPYYAIGTGCKFAIGAMAAGKSSNTAVEVASKHDPNTGFGVVEYKV